MTKRRLVLLLACAGTVLAVALLVTRSREPSYQGRSLSRWMDICFQEDTTTDFTVEEAKAAIRQIGTNGVPLLVAWMQYEPGRLASAADRFLSHRLSAGWPANQRHRRAWAAVETIAELARHHDLENHPDIQRLADNPNPGPLARERIQRLGEMLSQIEPRSRLYYRLTKAPAQPLTNTPPP